MLRLGQRTLQRLSRRSATEAVRGLIVASRPKATLATTHQDIPTLPP
eukprot:CAMPEP_0181503224 /NCGR_PEP_ID=MMETSP1110-20121109/56806_1 /TAXON_ID=174948 /ORGANISM="Symbiodinium sp., Strain CCMP421" /LENGTH=46 /DNA_ID= /DNA_START= /DNA_END= /DNA_ORIENTATION=